MGEMASQITSIPIVYLSVYSGADEIKHQSSASLVFVREFTGGRWIPPHKGPVTRKMFPFDDIIMTSQELRIRFALCCVLLWLCGVRWVTRPSRLHHKGNQTMALLLLNQLDEYGQIDHRDLLI